MVKKLISLLMVMALMLGLVSGTYAAEEDTQTGAVNVFLNAAVKANHGAAHTSLAAANMVDGSTDTRYSETTSATGNLEVTIPLNSFCTIDSIRFTERIGTNNRLGKEGLKLKVEYNPATTENSLLTVAAEADLPVVTGGAGGLKTTEVVFDTPITASFVKLTVIDPYNTASASSSEANKKSQIEIVEVEGFGSAYDPFGWETAENNVFLNQTASANHGTSISGYGAENVVDGTTNRYINTASSTKNLEVTITLDNYYSLDGISIREYCPAQTRGDRDDITVSVDYLKYDTDDEWVSVSDIQWRLPRYQSAAERVPTSIVFPDAINTNKVKITFIDQYASDTSKSAQIDIVEIYGWGKVYEPFAGLSNVFAGQKIKANHGAAHTSLGAANIVDNNKETRYSEVTSATGNLEIYFTLDKFYTLTGLTLTERIGTNNRLNKEGLAVKVEYNPDTSKGYVSPVAVEAKALPVVSSGAGTAKETKIVFDKPIVAGFVKLTVIDPYNTASASSSETNKKSQMEFIEIEGWGEEYNPFDGITNVFEGKYVATTNGPVSTLVQANMTDGDIATRYLEDSSTRTLEVTVDLDGYYNMKGLIIYERQPLADRPHLNVSVKYADSYPAVWKDVVESREMYENYSEGSNNANLIEFPEEVCANKIKLVFDEESNFQVSIFELEGFGTAQTVSAEHQGVKFVVDGAEETTVPTASEFAVKSYSKGIDGDSKTAVACFDAAGKLIACNFADVDYDVNITVPEEKTVSYVKVFTWESMTNVKPIFKAWDSRND